MKSQSRPGIGFEFGPESDEFCTFHSLDIVRGPIRPGQVGDLVGNVPRFKQHVQTSLSDAGIMR